MRRITIGIVALFFLFALPFTVAAAEEQQKGMSQQQTQGQQQQQTKQTSMKGTLAKGEDWKDMTVKNMKGEELGNVQDAIVNTKTGKVEYIVIQTGGIAGVGGEMIPVPINQFQVTKDKRLVLNATKDKLAKAPKLGDQWPPANEQKWAQNVKSYFGKQSASAGGQASTQAGMKSESQPTPMSKQ